MNTRYLAGLGHKVVFFIIRKVFFILYCINKKSQYLGNTFCKVSDIESATLLNQDFFKGVFLEISRKIFARTSHPETFHKKGVFI